MKPYLPFTVSTTFEKVGGRTRTLLSSQQMQTMLCVIVHNVGSTAGASKKTLRASNCINSHIPYKTDLPQIRMRKAPSAILKLMNWLQDGTRSTSGVQ